MERIIRSDFDYTFRPDLKREVHVGITASPQGWLYVSVLDEDTENDILATAHFSPKRARKLIKALKKKIKEAEAS
jgi:hypothetical protein